MPTLPALAKSLVRPPVGPASSHLANRLTVAAFALFLAVPLVGSFVMTPVQPVGEKRPRHPVPYAPTVKWKAQAFPLLFDNYFADRVGFRGDLLAVRQRLLVERLGDSISDTTWVGRDGWLFVNCVGPGDLPALQPDPAVQVQRWADALDERRRWLAARGIRYVVVVAPEKSSVYPEHLPAWAGRHPPPDLLTPLAARVPVVNPLPALVAAKAAGVQLYHKLDSHWTCPGADVAYRELGRHLEHDWPGYRMKPPDAFAARTVRSVDRDLAQALGRPDDVGPEEVVQFEERAGEAPRLAADELAARMEPHADRLKNLKPHLSVSPTGFGRAVLLHDSFGMKVLRLMASDFGRLAAVGTYGFPTNVIEAERPDVVIQLLVARALPFVKPARLPTMTP